MRRTRTKVYFDGGARPNPGPMEAAVVVRGRVHFVDDPAIGSSSDAEWQALINALKFARNLGIQDIDLIGDAWAVIGQAKDALGGGNPKTHHAAEFLVLAAKGPPPRLRWIRRSQNLAGIALDRRRDGLMP